MTNFEFVIRILDDYKFVFILLEENFFYWENCFEFD